MIVQKLRKLFRVQVGQLNGQWKNMPSQVYDSDQYSHVSIACFHWSIYFSHINVMLCFSHEIIFYCSYLFNK